MSKHSNLNWILTFFANDTYDKPPPLRDLFIPEVSLKNDRFEVTRIIYSTSGSICRSLAQGQQRIRGNDRRQSASGGE